MRVQHNLTYPALRLYRHRVKVSRAVIAGEHGADKLRERTAALGKRSKARLRLIDLDHVIHVARTTAQIGETQTDIAKLALDGGAELVYPAVAGVGIEANDALRWNAAGAGREWIREREEGLAVLNGVEEHFGQLERPAALCARIRSERFGEDPISAANHELVSEGAVGYSYARRKVVQRRALCGRSGRHLDRLNGIERTDLVERRAGDQHIARGRVPVVDQAIVVIGGAEALPAQTVIE